MVTHRLSGIRSLRRRGSIRERTALQPDGQEQLGLKLLRGEQHVGDVEVSILVEIRDRQFPQATAFEIGQQIDSAIFEEGQKIDVTGTSKGRGFAGVVKRHGYKVKKQTHGTHEAFRHAGSIGAGSSPGHVIKGMPMAGHLGNARVTIKNLTILKIDTEKNLLFVRGSVPGHIDGYVSVRDAKSGK